MRTWDNKWRIYSGSKHAVNALQSQYNSECLCLNELGDRKSRE